MTRARELAVLAVIALAFVLSLGRTVDYGYVWDDGPEIERNAAFDRPLLDGLLLTQTQRAVPELADLPSLQFGYDSYRPLLYATYWCDIHAWGRDAGALHRTNVVLGALAVLLAYLVARRWLGSPLALVPTALFALHPAQIETVAYVSARGDLLAGLFALAATYGVLRAVDARARGRAIAWTGAAAVAFAASLLSKEAYLALPLALGVLVASRPGGRARWWSAAALLGVAIAYVPVRGAMVATVTSPAYGGALAALPGVLLDYARIAALPFDLSIERAPHGSVVLGWAIAVGVVAVVAWRWLIAGRVLPPVWARPALAGVAWAVVLLGPSAIAVHTTNVVADRYLYLPLFGLGVAAAAAGARVAQARPRLARPLIIAAALWAAMLAVVAWQQVPVWQDMRALYEHALEIAPDSARAHYRVAVLDTEAGRWDLAVPELERAIELDPASFDALNNLGVYELRTNRSADAEALLTRAVAANPAHFRSWLNLGLAQLAQGHRDAGCASIAHALAINPRYEAARVEQQRSCAALTP